ncbi:MAG: DUF5717 family protein [Defluviitaleaceae bacterium]|nr:DUF5717 family protein [Defluviitaleaceae bacterium]
MEHFTKNTEKNIEERKVFLCEGVYTIKDFYSLWKENKNLAKRIFYYKEFELWLLKLKYPFMHFFEVFLKDANKERGLSNFFAFNNLKEEITLNIELNEETKEITITKTGEGFLEELIRTEAPWLLLDKNHITNKDFEPHGIAKTTYIIDKKRAKKAEYTKVYIGNQFVEIKTIEKNFLEIELLTNYKSIDDEMQLKITNNTNLSINVELEAKEIIKFQSTKYTIEEEPLIIDFKIKLSALQLARKTLGKTLIFEEIIRVYSRFENRKFYKDVPITIGDLYSND